MRLVTKLLDYLTLAIVIKLELVDLCLPAVRPVRPVRSMQGWFPPACLSGWVE